MTVLKLNWRELKQTPVSKVVRSKRWPGTKSAKVMLKNAENYANWVMKKIKETCGEPPTGMKYNAMCIFMTKKNIDRLNECLAPMDFLNYAPKQLDDIEDDQFAISKKEAFSER